MAIVGMAPAVFGQPASSAEYNKVVANIIDLDARLGPVVSGNSASTRLATLESRTTDTVTAPGGIGNQRLADRFGTGVGTGANVTTGSATSQLTDVRARLVTLETAPAPTSGPLGYKGENKRTTVDSVTTEAIMEVVTATLSAGRRYKATWDFNYDTNLGVGANFPILRIRRSLVGGSVGTSSTVVAAKNVNTVAVQTPCTIVATFDVPSNGVYQVGTSAVRAGANPVAIRYAAGDTTRILLVEDIGPV